MLLSSDDIRAGLSNRQRRHGARVFEALHEQLKAALEDGRPVVLDSTGMSSRFRTILRIHRASFYHIHLLLEDPKCFEERERARTDRPNQKPIPRAAFLRSNRIVFAQPPDLTITTDVLTPEQVYDLASRPS